MTSQEPLPRVVVRSTDVSSPALSDASIPSSDASDAPSSSAQDAGRETPSGVVRGGAGNLGESSGPDGASEPAAVYARSLARTQLRLAVACVVSFLAVVTLLTVTMSAVPTLGDVHLWGVPLPWLLHAYGFYPVIGAFALVFALAAARNERRFRALVDDE